MKVTYEAEKQLFFHFVLLEILNAVFWFWRDDIL